jgi:DNA modification methylase
MYDLLKEWESIDSELRELRRSRADWNYIRSLPQKIREAVEVYIETGDLWISAKIAGMTEDEFNEIRIRAGILW